jgi:nucleoside phosphorylase
MSSVSPAANNAIPLYVGCDVLLWCAKSEERQLLTKSLTQRDSMLELHLENHCVDESDNSIYPGVLNLNSGNKASVILVSGFRQGVESCGIALTNVLMLYRPKYAMMIGICAANSNVELGTVVMATAGLNYESGKVRDDGEMMYDSVLVPSTESKLSDFMVAYRDEKDLGRELTAPGTMLSGSAVREDLTTVYERLKNVHRGFVGLDMETSAFYSSCRVCKVISIGVFKGVSDNGGAEKDDRMHEIGVKNACKYGVEFIDFYFKLRNRHLSGAQINTNSDPKVGGLLRRYEAAKKEKDLKANAFSIAKVELFVNMEEGKYYKGDSQWYCKKKESKPSYTISLNSIGEIENFNLNNDQLSAIEDEKKRLKAEAEPREELTCRKTNPLKRKF